jgi:hypothetical protein
MVESIWPWVLIIIGSLVGILAVLSYAQCKGKKCDPDYKNLLTLGLVWLAIGLPLKEYFFSTLGIVLVIFTLAHRKNWNKGIKRTTKYERMLYVAIMLGTVALVLGTISFAMEVT